MTKQGIFDPYAPPKPKVPPKPKIDLEREEIPPEESSVRLDGDSYVLVLNNTRLEDVPSRLAEIVRDSDSERRVRSAISLTDTDQPVGTDVVTLPTPGGFLNVYVGVGGTEIDAFRRLGHMLYGQYAVLKKHNAKIVVR